jgi:ABC-type lipoprotein release transport system permease subunit
MILTLAGVSAGLAAGLALAPRLINAQGAASGIGWGIAVSLSPETIACVLGCGLVAATVATLFPAAARRDTLSSRAYTRQEAVYF